MKSSSSSANSTTTEERKHIINRVTLVGVLVNILLAAAQIVSGILSHSQALIADGMHTLADLFSDFVVLITAHHSAKAADADHPYGHGRFETLSSIFLGFALVVVAIGMGYRGLQTMLSTTTQEVESYAILFALLAIFSKEFLYRYTVFHARRIRSSLLESNALHHRSDVLSSIVVVIGVGAQVAGIPHMDALAAIVVSLMISVMGAHLVKKAFAELIDTSLEQDLIDAVKQEILNMDGVISIHSLRSRSMGGMGYIDTEVRVNPRLSVSEAHYITLHIEHNIKHKFDQISDITVHVDPVSQTDHDTILSLPSRSQLLFELYSLFESIPESEHIKNIHLHYLTHQVELDVILPLRFGCSKDQDLADEILMRTRRIPSINQVNIYYAP